MLKRRKELTSTQRADNALKGIKRRDTKISREAKAGAEVVAKGNAIALLTAVQDLIRRAGGVRQATTRLQKLISEEYPTDIDMLR